MREIKLEDLPAILAVPDSAPASQIARRELAILWLNVMSGRLNLSTELSIPSLELINTIEKFAAELETAVATGQIHTTLLDMTQQILAGRGITKSVCARMFYLQTGNKIQDVRWTSGGIEKEIVLDEPSNQEFLVSMGRVSFSPNHELLAIGTQGPMYLLDRASGELIDLFGSINPAEGTMQFKLDESEHWEVIGWASDSHRLLIAPGTLQTVAWIDLPTATYQIIPINGIGSNDEVDLAPNDKGFITIARHEETENLELYSFDSGQITTLFSTPTSEGHIYNPRFSPSGNLIAYQVHRSSSSPEYSIKPVSLRIFDLESKTHVALFEGKLTRWEPVWSPDGEWIAFYEQESGEKFIDSHSMGRVYYGNIWAISINTREIHQLTKVEGAAFRPVWSPDGSYLSFLTHNAEIGMVAIDQPGLIWQVAPSSSKWSLFTSYSFLP